MTDIRLEGIVHVYPSGVRALDGVDLEIRSGERVVLIGQNGSGKSTLVRHLDGLLRATEGTVSIGGLDASTRTVAQLAHEVGLVFQDPDRQIFRSSVRSEVEFGPRNLGLRGADLQAAVDRALAATGLDGEAATNPYDLGTSRRKLLALASVLAMETPVLVLDEPTTGQDMAGVARVEQIVAAAGEAGRTVIAISHDMRFAAERFERIVVLRLGRVILDGPPSVVFATDNWDTLASAFVEPPLPARIGQRLGLGSTPTDERLVEALMARAEDRARG